MIDLTDMPSSSRWQAGTVEEYREAAMLLSEKVKGIKKEPVMPDAIGKLVEEFEEESKEVGSKIHRLPASLADIGDQFIVPMALAIGPYHHGLPRLQGMEKVKRVAAYVLTRDSGHSYEEVYGRVLAVADQARRLYAEDAVSGISPDEFADIIMFHDACFLIRYMQYHSRDGDMLEPSPLPRFFRSNHACITNDIMLLENQLPWLVIEALLTATKVHLGDFIVAMGHRMQLSFTLDDDDVNMAPSDRPPHLLGHLRLHKQGDIVPDAELQHYQASAPIRAMELEGIGVKLESSKEDSKFKLDMRISKGFLFDKLFLPPLLLDRVSTSWLVNMVAFEVCTYSPSSMNMDGSSVCSYISFLAMLMHREEDVHKLRSKGLLRAELSDKQTVQFFNGLSQKIIPGLRYFKIMCDIQDCKERRWLRIIMWKFVSDNAKAIAAVLSIIGVLVGIFKALYSLKKQ